jgi:lysophospholipase L1-like esterase
MLKSLLLGTIAMVAAASCGAVRADPAPPWLAAWTAAPAGTTGIIVPGTQTIRDIISPRRLGNTIRLHLTNRQGTLPVTFAQVFVGLQQSGAQLVANSSKPFTFAGKSSVTLLPGHDVYSDPLAYPVTSYQKLAISMQNGDPALGIPAASSTHSVSRELNYYSLGLPVAGGPLGTAGADSGDGFLPFVLTEGVTFEASWEYIAGLDVANTPANGRARTVVAFGDSISDGLTVNPATDNTFVENVSNLGAEQRYEDFLQLRFNAAAKYRGFTIVNGAIAGNRLTQGPFAPFFGPKGLDRLGPDALAVPGVTDVILQLGINDIAFDVPAQTLGSHGIGLELENAYVSAINTLHAKGVRAILSTITPARGAGVGMFSPAVNSLPGLPTPVNGGALHGTAITDSIRREVNAWIMSTGAQLADAVVDIASCVANPHDTSFLNPAYNSGDNLHPNALGYQAIANCVNLAAVFP